APPSAGGAVSFSHTRCCTIEHRGPRLPAWRAGRRPARVRRKGRGGGRFAVRPAAHLTLLAALYTALNALKPVQIDDAAYACYARPMAARPLDPYGFAIFWYQHPEPANHVLAPPVLPYYWAFLHALAGERVGLVKLGLFPWAALLVWALYGLGRRF